MSHAEKRSPLFHQLVVYSLLLILLLPLLGTLLYSFSTSWSASVLPSAMAAKPKVIDCAGAQPRCSKRPEARLPSMLTAAARAVRPPSAAPETPVAA